MAAYASLASLVNIIEQIMIHPRLSTSLDNNHIQPLHEKAGLLLDFIEGNNYGGGSNEADDFERQITFVAHAAEDLIESHVVLHIHAQSASSSFFFKVVKKVRYMKKKVKLLMRRIGCAAHAAAANMIKSDQISFNFTLHLQQIVEDMDAILKRAHELKDKEGLRLREEEQPAYPKPSIETRETTMVGLEDELIQLMDELTNQQSSRRIVSIVGMGGMGETTLARNVYQNSLIKQHFDVLAWATVSQQYNLKDILSQLLSTLGKSSDTNADEFGLQLHKALFHRRYLIVLDDIWSVEVWNESSRFFPDNGNGSRIVLTTRLSYVANDCRSYCFCKNLLNESESWKLFCRKVFQHDDGCKGLPLSIVVIAGSLHKSPRTLGHWNDVANDITSVHNSKEKQETLDVLLSSYHRLPPHLKPCFLYIGVFKSFHCEISVSKIVRLWVAEGFLKPNGGRVLEDVAEDYLEDLIDRNLILVGKRSESGKMKCCEIHDLLRDLCLTVAEQQDFFRVNKGLKRGTDRRLIYTRSTKKGRSVETPLVRSMMATEVPKPVLDKCGLLRVLDVMHHESVENELLGCFNLRYLCLKLPKNVDSLWIIPTSISLVWNLQTMIFGKLFMSYRIVVAPNEIWKMQQLRHIECPELYLPPPPPLGKGQENLFILENLQTLKTLVNFWLSEEMCKIIPNIKELHLHYYVNFFLLSLLLE